MQQRLRPTTNFLKTGVTGIGHAALLLLTASILQYSLSQMVEETAGPALDQTAGKDVAWPLAFVPYWVTVPDRGNCPHPSTHSPRKTVAVPTSKMLAPKRTQNTGLSFRCHPVIFLTSTNPDA